MAERVTVTGPVYQPLLPWVPAMLATVVAGGVRSILMPETVAEAELPALSSTVAEAERLLPSPVMVESAGGAAMPERASLTVQ